jgi:hypothetical protein
MVHETLTRNLGRWETSNMKIGKHEHKFAAQTLPDLCIFAPEPPPSHKSDHAHARPNPQHHTVHVANMSGGQGRISAIYAKRRDGGGAQHQGVASDISHTRPRKATRASSEFDTDLTAFVAKEYPKATKTSCATLANLTITMSPPTRCSWRARTSTALVACTWTASSRRSSSFLKLNGSVEESLIRAAGTGQGPLLLLGDVPGVFA